MNIPWFNGRCDELNTYLIRYFKYDKMKNVVFWKHSGFWSTESKHIAYCKDGVHLNTQAGYLKYYQSVRAAIVTARK